MKLEFIGQLEREYNLTRDVKSFKVFLEYASLNDDRIMLVTKCKYFIKKTYKTISLSFLIFFVWFRFNEKSPFKSQPNPRLACCGLPINGY